MPSTKKSYSLEKNSPEANSSDKKEHSSGVIIISTNTKEEDNGGNPKRNKSAFLGFFYAFVTAAVFGLSSVIVKKLSYISPGQLTFARNAGVFTCSLPIAVFSGKNILGKKKHRIILVTRGLLGTTALYMNVLAYALLPLADAAIILCIIPAVTVLFARIHLRESCSCTQSVSLVITLCGVLLSARVPELLNQRSDYQFDYTYISGLAASAACVLTMSFTYVILRKMKDIHFSIPMLYFGVLGMIENAVINGVMVSYSPADCGWDQFLYVSIGILAFIANSTLTLAFQVEEAGIISVVRASSEIILAMIYQTIFFKDCPDLYAVGGGFLVILSLSILGIRNWLLSLPDNSKAREKLKYFLI